MHKTLDQEQSGESDPTDEQLQRQRDSFRASQERQIKARMERRA